MHSFRKRPYEGGQTCSISLFLGCDQSFACHPSIPSHPIPFIEWRSEVKWSVAVNDQNVCRSSSHRQEDHAASPQIPQPRITQLPRLVCVYGLLREGVGICTHQETRILRLWWRLVSVDDDDPIPTSIAAFLRTKIIVTHSIPLICMFLLCTCYDEARWSEG